MQHLISVVFSFSEDYFDILKDNVIKQLYFVFLTFLFSFLFHILPSKLLFYKITAIDFFFFLHYWIRENTKNKNTLQNWLIIFLFPFCFNYFKCFLKILNNFFFLPYHDCLSMNLTVVNHTRNTAAMLSLAVHFLSFKWIFSFWNNQKHKGKETLIVYFA